MNISIVRLSLLLSFAATGLLSAQTEKADSILLGNCTKSTVSYETVTNEGKTAGAALYYPESTMQMYKGCEITSIYLAISSYKTTESLQVFITHQLEEPYDYVQTVVPTRNNWNKVILDTPYVPDGKPVYIGYTIKGATMLNYTQSKETNEEWINQRDNQWTKYEKPYSAALYAIVEGEKLPQHNVRLKKVKMPYYARIDSPVPFQGYISNLGTETIHSLEFTYLLGETQQKEVLENLNIPSQSETSFLIDGLRATEEGNPDITLSVTAINGHPDADMTDNTSRTNSLLCRKAFVNRKVLLEVFSTERCPNCPSEHKELSTFLKGDERAIELGHHSGFYDDPLSITASIDYEWFYGDRLHAPALMLDRNNQFDNYPEYFESNTPTLKLSQETFPTLYAEALNAPAFATVELSAEKSNLSERSIRIHVTGKALLPLPENSNDRLFVFLTEDSIFSKRQAGADPQGYYHRHSARMCATDTWGDPIQIADGYQANYEVVIPKEWNANQMHVIAFVGNYDATNNSNCVVYNAESISLKSLFPTAISQITAEDSLIIREGNTLLFPNGCNNIQIYTSDGRLLLSDPNTSRLSLETLPRGSYILRVSTKNKQSTLKITL